MGLFNLFRREPTPNEVLLDGLQRNLVSVCERALRTGAQPDVVIDSRGFNALHYAVGKGYTNIVQLLLDCGADPNYRNPLTRHTHLMLAVIYEKTEALELLLKKGAKPNFRCSIGEKTEETPLHFATRRAKLREDSIAYRHTDGKLVEILKAYGATEE